jgi:hypothetical protein
MDNVSISDFKYVSKHADPDREYYGSAACRFIADDIITQILHNRDNVYGCEPRYFSHVTTVNTGHFCWYVSIDMDLLTLDSPEIIAVCNVNNTRIHVKGCNWFDNIRQLRGIESIIEAKAMRKAIDCLFRELSYLYSNRSKKYCKVFAEAYASDFE